MKDKAIDWWKPEVCGTSPWKVTALCWNVADNWQLTLFSSQNDILKIHVNNDKQNKWHTYMNMHGIKSITGVLLLKAYQA